MRVVLAVLLLVATGASAASAPAYTVYAAPEGTPGADGAGEPSIGIPWNTDDVFLQAGETTLRVHFEDGQDTWTDVTPPNSITNVDPMLHADPELGRIWAGGLDGPCSIMSFSDDNGETWTPTGNVCSGAQFDHQSIGSGPYALLPGAAFEHATYYCAQLVLTACARSLDGGLTWTPPTEVLGGCGGLHGHIRVSRATGLAAVPHKNCGDAQGFAYTEDDGLTWNSRLVSVAPVERGFDPSMQFGRDQGWLWFGQAGDTGAHIAMSRNEGLDWEPLGVDGKRWLDVGALADPPVVHANFADVQVGDDDRVAFSFLGLADRGTPYTGIHQCAEGQEQMVWHYYVALSMDAGTTWNVTRVTDDPVQVGGVFDGGFNPGADSSCRNLLDFNDMDVDSLGRVHIVFADGCTSTCAETGAPGSDGYRTRYATLLRQTGGPGLFAAFDDVLGNGTAAVQPEVQRPDEDTPGLGVLAPLTLLGLAALRRR